MEDFSVEQSLVGRIIGDKFCLRRCVGTGASGSVFQADQLALGRTVAVKILRPELALDRRFVSRFQDEALAASRLNHPNTVSVIDYGQTQDGLLYLVMEFLRGPTLTQVLRGDSLKPTRIADLVAQILSGLEEAHENGVIHADLKSDNIVVERRRGDWDLVKVVDFGIARLAGQPQMATEEHTICGTPEYMAPEIITGTDPTVASDLYAVGVVLYELLTGVTPFAGGSSMEVLRRHLSDAPVPPALRRPDLRIDPVLEECALKALAKNPVLRYSSAVEFRTAVTRVIGHRVEPGTATGPCPQCGAISPLSFRFCPDCGAPRSAAPAQVQAPRLGAPAASGKPGDRSAIATADTALRLRTPPSEEVTAAAEAASGAAESAAPSRSTQPGPVSISAHGEVVSREPAPAGRRAARGSEVGAEREFVGPEDTASVTVTDFPELSIDRVAQLPLTGRQRELARLVEFLTETGGDNALQVSGPPGAGRRRLCRAAIEALGSHATLFSARPDPTGLARPFHPLRVVARAALGIDPSGRIDDLAVRVDQSGLTARDLPAVAELLGEEGPLWQLEATVRRREILASLGRLFAARSEREPIVILFEDVDRYDEPSQEAIRRLVEVARGQERLRILLTNGPGLADRWPGTLSRLELGPLAPGAVAALVDHLRRTGLGDDETPAPDQVTEATGGNPRHVHQLLRYVVEGGALGSAPRGLADLVAARIDLLPQAAKLMCQAIAVLGTEATPRELIRLIDGTEDQLAPVASILVARDILVPHDIGRMLRFSSSLTRDVVYDSTPAHVRRDLHGRAARYLAERTAEPSVLGHHFELAGELEQATELLSRAGDEAVHELDDLGARRLYQRALAASRQLMLSDDDPAKRGQFVAVGVKLAERLRMSGEIGLARGLIDEVRDHGQESRGLRAQILRAEAHLLGSEGNNTGAMHALRDAIGVAIVGGQRDLLCELYLDLATSQLRTGSPAGAVTELEEGIDLVTAGEGPGAASGPRPLWRLCYRLAQLHALEGRRERAVQVAEDALRHANVAGARVGAARIQAMLASQLEQLGDVQRAVELRQRTVDEMRRLGDRRGTAEMLLDGAHPTRTFAPIAPSSLREAQELASEIGWSEGARRARQVTPTGRH